MKLLKEFKAGFAGVEFLFAVGVCKAAFFKNVGESDDGHHLLAVGKNFQDATQDVEFDGDIHARVILIRHIEQFGVAGKHLMIFHFGGDFSQR